MNSIVYLGLVILGGIILVVIVIRRLPHMRSSRLGTNYPTPRPYIHRSSPLVELWQRIKSLIQHILPHRRSAVTPPQSIINDPFVSPISDTPPRGSTIMPNQADNITAQPSDFWQEESLPASSPLDLPTRGLITRRSEAQKIAHELIVQADDAFRKKDFAKAEGYYLQAATKDPDNAKIYNRLGVIYLQMQNYKDAVEAFRGAIRFDDRVASRHYNMALAYLGKRDYRSAEKGLKEAIRLDPTNEKYQKTLQAIEKQPV